MPIISFLKTVHCVPLSQPTNCSSVLRGSRLPSDHTLQSYSQDWHSFLRLAHCTVPKAEISSGGVCEGEQTRRGPLPRGGNTWTFQTLPTSLFPYAYHPNTSPWRREPKSLSMACTALPGRDIRTERPPILTFHTGKDNDTLILPPSVHHPTFGTNFSIIQVYSEASIRDSRMTENEFMWRIWGSS